MIKMVLSTIEITLFKMSSILCIAHSKMKDIFEKDGSMAELGKMTLGMGYSLYCSYVTPKNFIYLELKTISGCLQFLLEVDQVCL